MNDKKLTAASLARVETELTMRVPPTLDLSTIALVRRYYSTDTRSNSRMRRYGTSIVDYLMPARCRYSPTTQDVKRQEMCAYLFRLLVNYG